MNDSNGSPKDSGSPNDSKGAPEGSGRMIPVWFFIGLLLLCYGAIILTTAILEYSRPSAVALSQYHPGLWGGMVLILLGGGYTAAFRPGRGRRP